MIAKTGIRLWRGLIRRVALVEMRPNDDAHNDKKNRQRDGHRSINIAIIAHRSA